MKTDIFRLAAILLLVVMLSGCNTKAPINTNTNTPNQTPINTQAPIESGDGTITISMGITNPEQEQEGYNLIFAPASSFVVGEALFGFKSYPCKVGEAVTVNIFDLYGCFESDANGNFKVGVSAARLEDICVRNPLSEIMILTFPNLETCIEGNSFNLEITDKPLTSLYPEGTLLVRIVDSAGEGGYVDFMYESSSGTLKYGMGSSGPDFLVAFSAEDFKKRGIRDAYLVITDFDNREISERIELHFDEKGYCEQGQYIEIVVGG
ncbi:MAG: hypothetical protein GX802_07315 [Clostridiales bacterium]|nr:hypothetical protein [Clostridiales bacterium]